ncbi:MAG: thiopurine S-methyltransferase [Gammaproteobacteria bacterium]|nr:thiopurine S-methyltransferase [Gammaproteobacteria bacterium]
MDSDFWLSKWEAGQLGFHQEKINSRLKRHWGMKGLNGGAVLVPLCGKSKDMLWLAEQGHSVVGVEISETACRDFFKETGLDYEESNDGRFIHFKSDSIELLQGDIFALTEADLPSVDVVYDRASLIALPPKMRRQYADHLSALLNTNDQILLIGMDYDQNKMKGPPFSVTEKEVRTLFSNSFKIDRVDHSSGPDIVGNLSERGLDTLTEKIYVMTKE